MLPNVAGLRGGGAEEGNIRPLLMIQKTQRDRTPERVRPRRLQMGHWISVQICGFVVLGARCCMYSIQNFGVPSNI